MVAEFAQIDNRSINRDPRADRVRQARETEMDHTEPAPQALRLRRIRPAAVALFALLLLSGPAFAACASAHPTASDGGWTSAMPTMDAAPAAAAAEADMPMAGAETAWAARPEYVRANARTEEAYQYAMQHPQIVQWMPCYCGCEAMGHGSNLDCYYKHGQPGDRAVFEEHASFCDICVDITLMTKQLSAEGTSLREIRQVIDQTFGGSAPGTPTEQPPV
jgi:hypothetical protein